MFISRLLELFEVDLEDEMLKILKFTSEVNQTMLHKIGLKKSNNGIWVCKAEGTREAGPSRTSREEAIVPAAGDYAMLSYILPVDLGKSLSIFEHMVL